MIESDTFEFNIRHTRERNSKNAYKINKFIYFKQQQLHFERLQVFYIQLL